MIIQINQFLGDEGYRNGDGSYNVQKTKDELDGVLGTIDSIFESEFKRLTSKRKPTTEVERPSSGDDEDPDEPGEGGLESFWEWRFIL